MSSGPEAGMFGFYQRLSYGADSVKPSNFWDVFAVGLLALGFGAATALIFFSG